MCPTITYSVRGAERSVHASSVQVTMPTGGDGNNNINVFAKDVPPEEQAGLAENGNTIISIEKDISEPENSLAVDHVPTDGLIFIDLQFEKTVEFS